MEHKKQCAGVVLPKLFADEPLGDLEEEVGLEAGLGNVTVCQRLVGLDGVQQILGRRLFAHAGVIEVEKNVRCIQRVFGRRDLWNMSDDDTADFLDIALMEHGDDRRLVGEILVDGGDRTT